MYKLLEAKYNLNVLQPYIDNGKLTVKNQYSPLLYKLLSLLTINVLEDAYYLKYQNRRLGYINNFFNLIDRNNVNKLYGNLKNGL